jgi:hypothetical protein
MLALAGCSMSVTKTVSPEAVAEAAATNLEKEVGVRPEMDCGDEAIEFAAGTTVDCVLTDPDTGTSFDAEVTLETLEGTDDLGVAVQVADTPRD